VPLRLGAKHRDINQPEQEPDMPSIFVNIAAYRDPECLLTIHDLLDKARWPERIIFGAILQTRPEDEFAFYSTKFNAIYLDAQTSKGACWARHLGYTLYRGEEYVLQIDSHMRFAEHWDEKMLAELAACPSEKPMLTTYAAEYTPPDLLRPQAPTIIVAQCFDLDRIVATGMEISMLPTSEPRPTALVSGHFMFAWAQWIRDVPYDPYLYFWGEEITMAVRLWTHGWDLFSPSYNLIWHQYGRVGRGGIGMTTFNGLASTPHHLHAHAICWECPVTMLQSQKITDLGQSDPWPNMSNSQASILSRRLSRRARAMAGAASCSALRQSSQPRLAILCD